MKIFAPTERASRNAAVAAAIGFGCIAIFQIALVAGAPLGRAAWGGANAQLSTVERIGSAVAVVVWTVAALIVLGRAGFWQAPKLALIFRWGPWALAGLSAVAALMNFASQSRWENFIWAPTALVLTVLCVIVARSVPMGHGLKR